VLSGEGFQMKNERKDLYYFNVRDDLIRLIPSQAKSILEVGCAGGMTGKVLKEKGFEEIVGIEVNEAVVKKGKSYYDKLIIGDVGEISFPFEKENINCILYGDILGHFVDTFVWKRIAGFGTNVVTFPYVKIDRHAVIGTHSVVIHDIPSYSVAVGSAARVIKRYVFNLKQIGKSR